MISDLFKVTLPLAAVLDLNSDDVLTQMYTCLLYKLVANYKTLGKPYGHSYSAFLLHPRYSLLPSFER